MLEHVPHVNGEVPTDEVVIIHFSSLVGEPKIFEPYTRVHLPGVSGDVGGWSKTLWKQRSLDATTKGPWPRAIWARAPVVWSATMPEVHVLALLDGQAEAHATYSGRHSVDVIIVSSVASIIDDAMSVRFGLSHSHIGGQCGVGTGLGYSIATASCSTPGNGYGEWTE